MPKIDPNGYVFSFGKHNGKKYTEVAETDPDYIRWCGNNIDWFELPHGEWKRLDILEHGVIDPDEYVFDFGKHAGESYRDVAKREPKYVWWAQWNVPRFNLPESEIHRLRSQIEFRWQKADRMAAQHGTGYGNWD